MIPTSKPSPSSGSLDSRLRFPKNVEEEAEKLPETLDERDYLGRDDFRNRNTITIDPTTARDFDDAVDVEMLKDGSFQLGVHIADVSHVVRPDSAMDIEARIRGTSVYFPDRVIPMLPEKVSNSLCSLNPKSGSACHERHHAHLA